MELDASLRARITNHLRGFHVQVAAPSGHRSAAVAVAVTEEGHGARVDGLARPTAWSTRAALILTRRAANLGNHAGQWALPGGRIDAGETPEQAALREMSEEVGLQLETDAVIGRLDDYVSRSGYVITPVVVWAGKAPVLAPNPGEVASVHRIAVSEFMRADAPLLDPIADSVHPVLRMPVGRSWIAAPTAAILYQFREVCIAGRATRVVHFEQPLFARK